MCERRTAHAVRTHVHQHVADLAEFLISYFKFTSLIKYHVSTGCHLSCVIRCLTEVSILYTYCPYFVLITLVDYTCSIGSLPYSCVIRCLTEIILVP